MEKYKSKTNMCTISSVLVHSDQLGGGGAPPCSFSRLRLCINCGECVRRNLLPYVYVYHSSLHHSLIAFGEELVGYGKESRVRGSSGFPVDIAAATHQNSNTLSILIESVDAEVAHPGAVVSIEPGADGILGVCDS